MKALACVVTLTLAACGTDGTSGDGGSDATAMTDGRSDAFGFADVGMEASPDAHVWNVVLDGGGPFVCGHCVCDGTKSFCSNSGGGPNPAPLLADAGSDDGGSGDASACIPDAGTMNPRCVAIPSACLPNPSCECLLGQSNSCSCMLDPSGNGLDVTCALP